MSRLRSVLIDCRNSKMYANVANTLIASESNLIATTRKSTLSLQIKPPGITIAVVTASQGTTFNTTGVVTSVSYKFLNIQNIPDIAASPQTVGATIKLRRVNEAGTLMSSTSYVLPIKGASGPAFPLVGSGQPQIRFNSGDTIYWDVVTTGTPAAKGLVILMDYYLGN